MTQADPITAARNAERELYRDYGLTVDERFIEIDEPRLRIRVLECGSPRSCLTRWVAGGLSSWRWQRRSACHEW